MTRYVYALLLSLICLSSAQASDQWDDPRDVKVYTTNAQGKTVRVITPLIKQKMDQAIQKFSQACEAGRPDQASIEFKNTIISCPFKTLRTHGYVTLASLYMDLNSFRVAYFYALDHGNDAPLLYEQYSLRYRHMLNGGIQFQGDAQGINEDGVRRAMQASAKSGLEAISKIIFEEAKRKADHPELERHPMEEDELLIHKMETRLASQVDKASYTLLKLGVAAFLTYRVILHILSWL